MLTIEAYYYIISYIQILYNILHVSEVLGVCQHGFGLTDQIPSIYSAFIKHLRIAGVGRGSALTIFILHELLGVISAGVFFSNVIEIFVPMTLFPVSKIGLNESYSRLPIGKCLKHFLLRMVRDR